MPNAKVNLLVVDDDAGLRTSLSHILTSLGHDVRCAEDGLSALTQIRREEPFILLSDLHMPGMTGFLLMSIVRQKFPAIRVIAMSSAFSEFEHVPPGVIADAFYQKGANLGALLQIMEDMANAERPILRKAIAPPSPILNAPERAKSLA
jgi:CheY-like chemotaxis protein